MIYVYDDVLDIKKFKLQDLRFSTPTICNFDFHDSKNHEKQNYVWWV